MIGDKSITRNIDIGSFEEEFLSATISGPIIKDRLWFFASYEKFEGSDPDALQFGIAGSGRASEIQGVTQADIDQIISISQSVYGYDPLNLIRQCNQELKTKRFWRSSTGALTTITTLYSRINLSMETT